MGNQQGKERRDRGRKIDWSTAEPPSTPGKPYLVPSEKHIDVITIQWTAPLTDGGAPITGYVVEHRKTGSPHWLRATAHLVRDTKLPLTGLEPGWRYQFRVSAENEVGRSSPGELSEPLTVTPQKWAASVPFFNVELQDKVGLENEKVEFSVRVTGIPTPAIRWYKDGFEIFSSRRTKIVTEDDRSVFIIHQAALEDEGEIKCTATNRAGHAITKANLKLEAPPRMRLPRQYEDGLIFVNGEQIRLKVTAAGRPKPRVSWYHNGEIIEKNDRIDIADSKTGSTLKIAEACRSDRGEYEIAGVNKIGEDVVSVLVTVTDRPSPPGRIQVSAADRKVQLAWSKPEDDGGCEIGSYIVEYFRVGWDMWLKAKSSRQTSISLENLIEGSEYKFRVRAENPYGISDPSQESEFVFLPDLKRGLFGPSTTEKLQILKETTRNAEIEESEETRAKRRMLEEKAKRLLDSPQITRCENGEKEKKRKAESSAESIWTDDGEQNMLPTVPRRKNKGKKRLNLNLKTLESEEESKWTLGLAESSDETRSCHDSNSTNETFPEITRNDSTQSPEHHRKPYFDGRGTFSLDSPLQPRERDDSTIHGSSELMLLIYPKDRSKSIELVGRQREEIEMRLGGEGIAPPMSLSSPELSPTTVFEQPFMRDAFSSTELLNERTAARLYRDSIEEEARRIVKRRFSLNRKSAEKRASWQNQISDKTFGIPQEDEDRREESIDRENETKSEETQKEYEFLPKNKSNEERSGLVEKDRLEFQTITEISGRRIIPEEKGDNRSDEATTKSRSFEVNEGEEMRKYSKGNTKSDSDAGAIKLLKLGDSKIPVLETATFTKDKRMSLIEQERETYHPGSMIPTRSVRSKVEITENEIEQSTPTSETKKRGKTSKIPVSSLERTKKTSKLFNKFGLRKGKKIPEVISENSEHFPPPKPILKNKTPVKVKKTPVRTFKLTSKKSVEKIDAQEESEKESTERKKKVRIAEPEEENAAPNEEEENRKRADETAMENQVLIYHYSDILKEFGGNKRTLERHRRDPPKQSSRESLGASPIDISRGSLSASPIETSRESLGTSPIESSRESLGTSPTETSRESLGTSPIEISRESLGATPKESSRESLGATQRKFSKESIGKSSRESSRESLGASPKKFSRESIRKSSRESSKESLAASLKEPSRESLGASPRKSSGEFTRKSSRESSRESLGASPRKSPSESTKKSFRESSKESKRKCSRESPSESPREFGRKFSRESSRESIRKSSKESPGESSGEHTRKSFRESPGESHKEFDRKISRESSRESIRKSSRESSRESLHCTTLKPRGRSHVAKEKEAAKIRAEKGIRKPEAEYEAEKNFQKTDTEMEKNSLSKSKKTAPNRGSGMRFALEYATDVAMFILACWLYFFKSEIYAIPILCLMAYRQLKKTILENYEKVKSYVSSENSDKSKREKFPKDT